MSKELLHCPHCGKTETVTTWQDDIEVNPDGYWTVVCCFTVGGCGAMCGYRETEDEAIDTWNTRYERTCEIVDKKHCSECGDMLWATDRYCSKCGAKVAEE